MWLLDDPSGISFYSQSSFTSTWQPTLIFYWCSFKECELLSDVLGALRALPSLHIQIGDRGDRGAPQIVAWSIFSTNSLHCVRNNLLKKAVLFIKPVTTSKDRTLQRQRKQRQEYEENRLWRLRQQKEDGRKGCCTITLKVAMSRNIDWLYETEKNKTQKHHSYHPRSEVLLLSAQVQLHYNWNNNLNLCVMEKCEMRGCCVMVQMTEKAKAWMSPFL